VKKTIKRLNKKESFLPQFNEEPSKEADPLQKPFGKKFYKAKYMSQKNILKSSKLAQQKERETFSSMFFMCI
jgi:hypothetical protein